MNLEPKDKFEAIDRLVNMNNREMRRKQFKKWRKQFGLTWEEITEKTKKQ